MNGRPIRDPDRRLLSKIRGDVTVQVAGVAVLLLGILGTVVYRTAATGLDAPARRRLLRTVAATEAAALPVALLTGRAIADRTLAPLDEALARRRRFAADVGHELRAPLTRLHTRAQLTARRLRNGTDVTADVDRLVTGTRQLGEVVEDVLASAVPPGRGPAALVPVDLGALARELAAAESARALERGVTIEVTGPDGASTGGPVVPGRETALRRVLSALVDNALGHTHRGGRVRLSLSSTPALVELTVRDDGDGFDPRGAGHLFDRFASGRSGGHGLGLALAREVVEGLGGTLTAEGGPGAGAAFTIRFPTDPHVRARGRRVDCRSGRACRRPR
ncbi:signal transduction histidine kinase [Actinomadura pelletieri DSM 43383]|uniref:histidine kinase n=1 Tax=Actinomadura pelletieri DSM 43383 TaxID=1120940 RepID=A0A495QI70_9ACTN|nr:HAMP domain-containing sensor histidine kinase [Actinomadura pelletieri]RKS71828.1 signal transduction histidine kinase [Actinomadura pelletieri DSM 43383]